MKYSSLRSIRSKYYKEYSIILFQKVDEVVPMNSIFLLLFLSIANFLSAQHIEVELNTEWQFRQVGTEKWYPATVPGTVHTDLLANGIIEDPFIDNNEIKQQWIEKENWEYKTHFDVDDIDLLHHELNFKGLDTYAEVFLNGKKILEANNMFRSWNVDVTKNLRFKGNELRILFTSPILKNDSIAKSNIRLPGAGDTSETPVYPYTRKAAYHFGWDWAPRFVTCGIWKEIKLISWSGLQVRDVLYQTNSLNENVATITAWISIESDLEQELWAFINEDSISLKLDKGKNYIEHQIHIDEPKLWWPNGSGEPYLYGFQFGVFNKKGHRIIYDWQNIGLRTVELINEPDSIGTSFYFEINGKPIFMKGANYVPQDVFLPRVKPEHYVHLLELVRDAGMNMIRVWGGGVYERDIFYDLCDQYGIMVWQDFMFANTLYPADSLFDKNVMAEVSEQASRLSKHCCLALFCGNNEIEVAWKNWGWQEQYDYGQKDSLQLWYNYAQLFKANLDAFVFLYGNGIPYVSTSPLSNWGTPENFNHGSMHYWGVWHGDDDFSGFNQNVGRFMVEWGFQSFPDYDLLTQYISPDNLSLDSDVMKNRQKSYVGNGKILEFLQQYATYGGDPATLSFQDFVRNSQWVQGLGYNQALTAHLKKQPHCMGTLLWQLNDCWPGPSWSIINYDGKPKPAYEEVKKIFKEAE